MKNTFSYRKYGKNLCSVALGLIVIATVGLGMVKADESKNNSSDKSAVTAKSDQKTTESSKSDDRKPGLNKSDKFKDLEKTKIEIEKVKKDAPKIKNPNPDATDPKQKEFTPEVKTTENTVENGVDKTGSNKLNFKAQAPTNTTTENTVAPLTVTHVYDYSSSYAGKIKDSLRMSKKIIEANSPESKHILQLYPDNYGQSSYHASGQKKFDGTYGSSSVVLTKQEALDIIDKLLAINAPSEKNPTFQNYNAYFQGLADALGNKRYLDESVKEKDGIPFETIAEKLTKPTDTISVIQYTDGWMDKETGHEEVMDKSFAEWAKGRAKTFMSVINRNQVTDNDTNSNRSLEQMRELGHPNIYDATGKDPKVVDAEVIKQFLETATEKVKVTKGEDQTAKITIGGDGIKITKALLKGGKVNKELPIKDGKVDVSEKLPDGNYEISYNFTGVGTVTASVSLDGKEAAKKMDSLKNEGGAVTADFRTVDGKEIPGKSNVTISEAGKEIGNDWQAPEVQKELTVDGDTYILTGKPEAEAGKVTKDTVTLHYVYEKKPDDKKVYSLKFKVLNALTNEQIDQDILVTKGFSGDVYEIKPPTVDGFEVTLKEGEEKGKFAENDLLLTYLAHEKGEEVKAIFVNEKGEEVKKSEIVSKAGTLVGKDWTFASDIDTELTVKDTTYVLKAVPEKLEGKVSSDKQTLKFIYKEKEKPTDPKKPEEKPDEPKKEEPKTLPKTSAVKASSIAK
ncbi:MucBP domain-containing protein [Streptococcus cristatus]|uniref:MucBP domain-containing protein n=1 Tax=Streptococcus cristatus TaxID=45634 RepID=UPI0039C16F6E